MKESRKFSVYVLRCSDSTYYCGYAGDVKARIAAHNKGKASKYTRARLPVKLAYFESGKTKCGALKREAEIKAMNRKQKECLMKKTRASA
ncbi:MAG: GIY-YIG nuclease family protein [Candidatus Diapherotrites archaeon]|nr:GIY-YIG nuclease family protein [Candidatus Diapherotrites archaeon]